MTDLTIDQCTLNELNEVETFDSIQSYCKNTNNVYEQQNKAYDNAPASFRPGEIHTMLISVLQSIRIKFQKAVDHVSKINYLTKTENNTNDMRSGVISAIATTSRMICDEIINSLHSLKSIFSNILKINVDGVTSYEKKHPECLFFLFIEQIEFNVFSFKIILDTEYAKIALQLFDRMISSLQIEKEEAENTNNKICEERKSTLNKTESLIC